MKMGVETGELGMEKKKWVATDAFARLFSERESVQSTKMFS